MAEQGIALYLTASDYRRRPLSSTLLVPKPFLRSACRDSDMLGAKSVINGRSETH